MLLSQKKEKKTLLIKENIKVNCKTTDKESVIKEIGAMLVHAGYVKEEYVQGMLEREDTFATYMGSGLAIPHGTEQVKKGVLETGIAVMVFPHGVMWGEEKAYIVIGIAAVGEEHMDVLEKIATMFCEDDTCGRLLNMNVEEIYDEIMEGDDLS